MVLQIHGTASIHVWQSASEIVHVLVAPIHPIGMLRLCLLYTH